MTAHKTSHVIYLRHHTKKICEIYEKQNEANERASEGREGNKEAMKCTASEAGE